ncbi:MAG: type II toxin-antitoxin system RelE/ParE family toxin [Patescibacteria group bacterium]
MNAFFVTQSAQADLESIRKFIADDDPDSALLVIKELRQAFERLSTLPNIGHLRNDLAPGPLRFWPVRSYLIIYRPELNPIHIIRILHGARDVRAILEDL